MTDLLAIAHTYDEGDLVSITAEFTKGVAIDPTALSIAVKSPNGTVTTYVYGTNAELVREALGRFRLDVLATAEGYWYYRIASAAAGEQAAEERAFIVRPSVF